MTPPFDVVIYNTSEVLCVTGAATEPAEKALAAIPKGVVGIREGRIAFLGEAHALEAGEIERASLTLDAQGGFVGPGFVDCHTHVVFAGERNQEFDLRNRGASYLEIAEAGGGIMNTVRATREASEEELVSLALPRLKRLLEHGVTSAEAKSGYELTLNDELKMLRAIATLNHQQPVALSPTLLCAHAVPAEYKDRRADYVQLCIKEIIPACAKLARFCDVFTEQGAFTLEETRDILRAAKTHGLIPRLHAEQLSASGAVLLAAEVGASSADHLEYLTADGARALAAAGVAAVLVPVSTLFLRQRPYASGRLLKAAGVTIALGTNVNPGSAMSESVPLTLGLACLENGLSAAEAYYAFTAGSARALQLAEAGRLAVGGPADVVLFRCASYRHLPYHLGINHVATVLKAGRVVSQVSAGGMCG